MDTLIPTVLANLLRNEAPPFDALEFVGECEPARAADAFLKAATRPELAETRSSWVPALLVSASPGRGAELLYELAETHARECGEDLDPRRTPALAMVLGSSEQLGRLLIRRPEWLVDLASDPPPPPDLSGLESDCDWPQIREARQRGLLRAVARELLGCPLRVSFDELSGLTDACLGAGLSRASAELEIAPPAMLALGQLGCGEAGISPEVELFFVDADATGRNGKAKNRAEEVLRLVHHLVLELGRPDEFGPLLRVGLESGRDGVVSGPISDSIEYFGSPGLEGARQRLLSCRRIAGPESIGREFVDLAAAMLSDAGDELFAGGLMQCRSAPTLREQERDMRSGDGGLFELEVITRTHQLRNRVYSLGTGALGVLDSLRDLSDRGMIDSDEASDLIDAYEWLRRAEHALQLLERVTDREFPADPRGQIGLARCMGYREPDAVRARERLCLDREIVREEVSRHFDSLFHPDPIQRADPPGFGLISASENPIKPLS